MLLYFGVFYDDVCAFGFVDLYFHVSLVIMYGTDVDTLMLSYFCSTLRCVKLTYACEGSQNLN